ncbi:MAG: type II toxin-antitoxin system VapC family toxin [Nitrososphaerales archaeon]
MSDNKLPLVYLDTNVFLNVVYKESKFESSSANLLKRIQEGATIGITSAVTLLEITLDMTRSGIGEDLIMSAVSTIEDIPNLTISSLDMEIAKDAAKYVLKDKLQIHDSYHLATALRNKAHFFVTRDEKLARKANKYLRVSAPERLGLA